VPGLVRIRCGKVNVRSLPRQRGRRVGAAGGKTTWACAVAGRPGPGASPTSSVGLCRCTGRAAVIPSPSPRRPASPRGILTASPQPLVQYSTTTGACLEIWRRLAHIFFPFFTVWSLSVSCYFFKCSFLLGAPRLGLHFVWSNLQSTFFYLFWSMLLRLLVHVIFSLCSKKCKYTYTPSVSKYLSSLTFFCNFDCLTLYCYTVCILDLTYHFTCLR
jgi:hypothetical protein